MQLFLAEQATCKILLAKMTTANEAIDAYKKQGGASFILSGCGATGYLGRLESALRVGKLCLKHPALFLCGKLYFNIQSTTLNLYLSPYLHIITNISTYFQAAKQLQYLKEQASHQP